MADNVFMLSDEAYRQLDALSHRYNAPFLAVIEMLIADRYSVSDQEKNIQRALTDWEKFIKGRNLKKMDPGEIYHAGYEAGWLQFQTRHGNDKFVIPLDKP